MIFNRLLFCKLKYFIAAFFSYFSLILEIRFNIMISLKVSMHFVLNEL